jgi:ATP-binding cassette subfamily B protein
LTQRNDERFIELVVTEREQKLGNWEIFTRLIKLCSGSMWMAALVVFFNACYHGSNIVGLNFIGAGIDYLIREFQDASTVIKWPLGLDLSVEGNQARTIFSVFAAIICCGLLKMTFQFMSSERMANLVHIRIIPKLQRQIFEKIQNMSFVYFNRTSSGSIINKAAGDVSSVRSFVDTVLVEGVTLIVTISLYTANMLMIHTQLALVCMSAIPLMMIASFAFSRIVRPRMLESRSRFDRLVLALSENIEGIKTVKGLSLESSLAKDLNHRNDRVESQQRKVFWCISLFSPTINFLSQTGIIILLVYGGKLAIDGIIEIGTGIVVFATLLQQFSNQINSFANLISAIQESFTGAQRIFEVIDTPIPVDQPSNPVKKDKLTGQVTFEAVDFEFTPNKTALQAINFSVEPGTCVASDGRNRIWKVCHASPTRRGFMTLRSGVVKIDGIDIRELRPPTSAPGNRGAVPGYVFVRRHDSEQHPLWQARGE